MTAPDAWAELAPATEEEAQARRDALNEAITDDARWIQRRAEIAAQAQAALDASP